MNPTEIKQALSLLGGTANKSLGQHFLIDESALQAIVDAAELKKGETVLEVGPGLGVLTRELVARGASVVAIEQDRRFVGSIASISNVHVTHGDAARLDWEPFVAGHPWKFVSNLPYSITSLALRKSLWTSHPPQIVVVLVQREVAERAIAKDGKTSLLSLMVALASSSARIVKRVPAGAFYPPPKVESAILQIVPMPNEERARVWGMEPEEIMSLAKKGFAHPRKFLASNLELTVEQRAKMMGAGIEAKARAEDLSPRDWANLAKALR